MAKYLYRSCPKCGDYLGVVIPEPPEPVEEIKIDAACLRCGYKLPFRKIVVGKQFCPESTIFIDRHSLAVLKASPPVLD